MSDGTVPRSGVVIHKRARCRGCRICELVCSATHEGVSSSYLSRIHIEADDFAFLFPAVNCLQCRDPECYSACPRKDVALCIDERTGARFVDESECDGCGACAEACRLSVAPIWSKTEGGKTLFFKCDLCRDNEEGPQCVSMCPWGALQYVERAERERD